MKKNIKLATTLPTMSSIIVVNNRQIDSQTATASEHRAVGRKLTGLTAPHQSSQGVQLRTEPQVK